MNSFSVFGSLVQAESPTSVAIEIPNIIHGGAPTGVSLSPAVLLHHQDEASQTGDDIHSGIVPGRPASSGRADPLQTCVICYEELNHNVLGRDNIVAQLPCQHQFHAFCILGWFTAPRARGFDCPGCRRVAHFLELHNLTTDQAVGRMELPRATTTQVTSSPVTSNAVTNVHLGPPTCFERWYGFIFFLSFLAFAGSVSCVIYSLMHGGRW